MITVVMGPACSGKSTWVQERKLDGDVVMDFDLLAQALGSPDAHGPEGAVLAVTWAARAAVVAKVLEGVDADAWLIWLNPPAEKIRELGEQGVRFHVMDTPLEVCLERAEKDERPEGTTDRIREWFDNPPDVPDDYLMKGGPVHTKQVMVQMKADGLADGQFTGYAAVFDNKDSYGDVIRKDAFTESLAGYGEKGAGIPCYWSHQMSNPLMCIGETVEAREDDRGLFVKVQLDLDTEMGAQVHRLIKAGRVNQMSFAFDIEDYAFAESDELGDYMELRKLKLHEVSVVQVGANQETELLDVKDRLTRMKDVSGEAALRQAASLIDGVLSAITNDSGKAATVTGLSGEQVRAEIDRKKAQRDALHPSGEPPTDSGNEPEPPAGDAPGEQVKTGGHPDLALATINTMLLEGAQA